MGSFLVKQGSKKKYCKCLFCVSLWACEVCVGRSFRAIFTRGTGQFSNAAVWSLRRSEWIYIAPSRLGLLCSFNAFCTHIKRHLSPSLTAWLRGVIRLNTLGTATVCVSVTERVSKSEFVRLVCFYICSEWISAPYKFVHTPDNPIRHALAFRAFFAPPYNLFKLCQCVFQNESIWPTVADCLHLLIYGLGLNLWFGKMTHYHEVIHHAVLNDSRSSFLPCLLVSCDCLIWWTWQRKIEEDSI